MSDDELMKAIASGNRKALASLFETYCDFVLGYAHRLLGSPERAEDLSQEVWLRVVRSAEAYSGSGQFKAWIKTLTRNACFNEMRQQKRWEPKEDVEALAEAMAETNPGQSIEEKLMMKNKLSEVKQAIDELPDMQRLALVSYLNEGCSYEELARDLEISVPSVKSLIFRARRSLSKKFNTGALL